MATVETEHTFDGKPEEVFAAIRNYEKYPKYLPGVTDIAVLSPKIKGSLCQVKYEISLIRRFFYTINMFEQAPKKIWWELEESNLMNDNNGSWELSEAGKDKTRALYKLDVKFKGLVPSMITDQIAKANLPAMMAGFQKLISDMRKS